MLENEVRVVSVEGEKGDKMEKMIGMILGSYLLICGIVDWRSRKVWILPWVVMTGLMILALLWSGKAPIMLLYGALPGGILIVVSGIKGGHIGLGDGLLVLTIGMYLGAMNTLFVLLTSMFLSAIAGAVLLIVRKVGWKYTMPFVPYLCVGYWVVMLC